MRQVKLRTEGRKCVFCGKSLKKGQKIYLQNNRLYQHVECNVLEKTYMGPIGVLERDSEGSPRCHICGWYMPFLGKHIAKHEWTATEYKEAFGLNRQEPLCSPDYSENRAAIAKKNQDDGKFPSGEEGKKTLPHPQRKLYPRIARAQERLVRRELLKKVLAKKREIDNTDTLCDIIEKVKAE